MTARSDRSASVVSLAAYREAVRAATFLRGCLHEPAWLKEVVAELAEDGEPRVAVVLHWQTALVARCLPRRVNGVQVLIREV